MLRRLLLPCISPLIVVVAVGGAARAAPCELESAEACYQRGVERFKQKDAEAAAWFERACESGAAEGCTELGFLLMDGTLVARDDKRSLAASLRACELGSGLGCDNAFVMVRDGRGGPRDDVELRRLADRACALEDAEGCYLAAAVHGEPLGGELDQQRSNAALDKSCKLGFGMACAVVGHRHLEGSYGYVADEQRAVRMLARACELGSGDACTVVGVWSLGGEHGLKADREKALELFTRGCELEDADGCARKEKLAALTAAGTLQGKLARRSSKRVLLTMTGGDVPPPGALGEVAKQVETAGITVALTIAKVRVKRVDGMTVELEVTEDTSSLVVDGKKVDHWRPGIALTLTWKRAPPAATP